jgi:hypothetical protein
MFLSNGERPVFLTAEHNATIIVAHKLHGPTEITTPNLTGRLNAIVEYAEMQLTKAITKIEYVTLYYHYSFNCFGDMASAAALRLHEKELKLWGKWFRERHYEAWGMAEAANFAEMQRLDELQHNGFPPF